jgi:uncharacterized protein
MGSNRPPTLGNGKICYLEIPSTNPQVAASFYEKIFGWTIRKRSDGHLAFDDGVGEVSGAWVQGRQATSEPGIIIYIWVESVQHTIDMIKTHGGKIVQPIGMDAPEITARFGDLDGNIFGLYQEPAQ